jgi:hypothetical protein
MSLSRCTEGKFSDWEDSWEQGVRKRLRRSLGFAHGKVGSSILTANSMHQDAPPMRSGPASDSSPRIASDFEELLTLCERVVVMSDGASIADVPSEMLNEEKLTLFAAPRTSMEQNSAILRDIARDLNGAAFWTLVDQGRLFCLYHLRDQ